MDAHMLMAASQKAPAQYKMTLSIGAHIDVQKVVEMYKVCLGAWVHSSVEAKSQTYTQTHLRHCLQGREDSG